LSHRNRVVGCHVMTGALVRIDPFTFTSLRYLIAGAAFSAVLIFKEGWSAVHV